MKRIALATFATLCAVAAAAAETRVSTRFSSDGPLRAARSIDARSRPSIWGMPAVNYHLDVPARWSTRPKASYNQIALLVAPPRLEEPDADAQSGRDLPDAVLQHTACRTGGAGDSACGRWRVQRQHHELLAGRDRGRRSRAASTRARVASTSSCRPAMTVSKVPDGYIPMPSDTYRGYALLRSVLKSGSEADVAKAVAYAKRIKLYPFSQAANPPPTTFVDASGRRLRFHDPLRHALLRVARPHGAGRAVA